MRAIDAQGLEGLDASAAFRVSARPVPPYALAPVEDGNASGPRPRFRWTRSEEAAGYRLQVAASADFSAPLVDIGGIRRTELRVSDALAPGEYQRPTLYRR